MGEFNFMVHSLSVHSLIIHPPQSPALILSGCHVMVYLFGISFAIIISGESQNNGTQGCFDGAWNGSEWALVLISTLSPSLQKITGYRDNWPLLIIQLDGVELFKSSHQHTELSICNGQSSEWMNGQKGKEMWSKDAFACLNRREFFSLSPYFDMHQRRKGHLTKWCWVCCCWQPNRMMSTRESFFITMNWFLFILVCLFL